MGEKHAAPPSRESGAAAHFGIVAIRDGPGPQRVRAILRRALSLPARAITK